MNQVIRALDAVNDTVQSLTQAMDDASRAIDRLTVTMNLIIERFRDELSEEWKCEFDRRVALGASAFDVLKAIITEIK